VESCTKVLFINKLRHDGKIASVTPHRAYPPIHHRSNPPKEKDEDDDFCKEKVSTLHAVQLPASYDCVFKPQ
jgi:hypothetical protein